MGRCIKLNVKSIPKYKGRINCQPLSWTTFENIVVARNTLVVIPRVYKARKFHMKKNSVHEKNEHLNANVKKNTIGYKVFCGATTKRKKKLV